MMLHRFGRIFSKQKNISFLEAKENITLNSQSFNRTCSKESSNASRAQYPQQPPKLNIFLAVRRINFHTSLTTHHQIGKVIKMLEVGIQQKISREPVTYGEERNDHFVSKKKGLGNMYET